MKRGKPEGKKTKLGLALTALAVSAVLLTTASFAWYTISTRAEAGDLAIVFRGIKWPFEAGYTTAVQETDAEGQPVVDKEGNPVYEIAWAKELNVSQYLKTLQLDTCVLRPISTYDLTHWYTAQYSVAGSVNGFEAVQLQNVANLRARVATEKEGSAQAGDETDGNCLIYFDLLVRETNEGEQAGLKLSTVEPRLLSGGGFTFGDALVSETVEGTFVLTKPSVGAGGKYAAKESGGPFGCLHLAEAGIGVSDAECPGNAGCGKKIGGIHAGGKQTRRRMRLNILPLLPYNGVKNRL